MTAVCMENGSGFTPQQPSARWPYGTGNGNGSDRTEAAHRIPRILRMAGADKMVSKIYRWMIIIRKIIMTMMNKGEAGYALVPEMQDRNTLKESEDVCGLPHTFGCIFGGVESLSKDSISPDEISGDVFCDDAGTSEEDAVIFDDTDVTDEDGEKPLTQADLARELHKHTTTYVRPGRTV